MNLLYSLLTVTLIINIYGQEVDHECEADEQAAIDIKNDPTIKEQKDKDDVRWGDIKKATGGHTAEWDRRNGIDNSGTRRRLQLADGNIDIPIIFHILYNGNSNAHDKVTTYSTFVDRLQNINLNFNQDNPDISNDPNWSDILGDMDMTFFINKILYYNVGANSPYAWHSNAIKTAGTGAAPIDSNRNLNVWFARPNDGSPSGYASFPWDNNVGAVFNSKLINGDWAGLNWGQYHTIFSHEFGHWVGLYHIWGYSPVTGDSPRCDADDGVIDTPNMSTKWGNECPADGVNSCADGEPDMFENFMSYASCINMFTDGQVARARANFAAGGNRQSFIDYKSNPADYQFVNMFYFITGNNECMKHDIKRNININTGNGGTQIFLCVSYSDNPYIDIYNGIQVVPAANACPANYMKMDTNLNTGNSGTKYNVCYRRVAQSNPLSSSTISDLDIKSYNSVPTSTTTSDGYTLILTDLNSGSGSGTKIYLATRTGEAPQVVIPPRTYVYHAKTSDNRWLLAQQSCSTIHGTSLATFITDQDRSNLMSTIGSKRSYIGLTDQGSAEGVWRWQDGTSCAHSPLCIDKWKPGEPNNVGDQDCSEMTGGFVDDLECNVAYYWMNGYTCNLPSKSDVECTPSIGWAQLPGRLMHVSIGYDGEVWGVNSGHYIYRWTGSTWAQISGRLKQISVGSATQIWGVNSNDYIYKWNGSGWTQKSGRLKYVSVGYDGTVWGINSNDNIYKWNGSGWTLISGGLKQISVGSVTQVWGVNANGNIYYRDFSDGSVNGKGWINVAGGLKHVSVGYRGNVWGVNSNDNIYVYHGSGWTMVSGLLKQIDVGGNMVWGVNSNDYIYRSVVCRELVADDFALKDYYWYKIYWYAAITLGILLLLQLLYNVYIYRSKICTCGNNKEYKYKTVRYESNSDAVSDDNTTDV